METLKIIELIRECLEIKEIQKFSIEINWNNTKILIEKNINNNWILSDWKYFDDREWKPIPIYNY